MPRLSGRALQLYASCGDSEYENYNQSAEQYSSPSFNPVAPKFTHRLFHDAESTFWVMAWFLARSAPKGYQVETDWNRKFETFITEMESHSPANKRADPRADFSPDL